ncbi:S66 family peptidase [Veronia nyctiphanis]|uniref:S66 family peptidase n=1 Tax=Veronia nyctiphanis TaxID=1278244 RepID=UPI00191C24E9|nr:S66 peptidase family protein [Veronia nyctiphanis]
MTKEAKYEKTFCAEERRCDCNNFPVMGGATAFPDVFRSGIQNLEKLGFRVVKFPTTKMTAEEVFKNPAARAEDINKAFADPDIKGIVSSIGGSDSVRILKYLDAEIIAANPKFIMGYSDFTTIATYLNQLGVVTFLGPSVMAGLAQFHNAPSEYQAYFSAFLAGENHLENWPVFPVYSDGHGGYPDWDDETYTGKFNTWKDAGRPRFIQGSGKVNGKLFGGCIEVLEMMKGIPFWPQADFWQGKILVLETSEEKPSIDYVRYSLRNFGVMGALERLSAIFLGRPTGYSETEKRQLEDTILSVLNDEFGLSELPVVTNLSFGHTDPQLVLPFGIDTEIDCDNQSIRLRESAFL